MSDDRYADFSDDARHHVVAELANMLAEGVPGATPQQVRKSLGPQLEAIADRLIEAWEKGEKIPPGPVKVDKAVQQFAMARHEEELAGAGVPPKIRAYAKKWTASALGINNWPMLFYWAILCRFGHLAYLESPKAVPPFPTGEAERRARVAGYQAAYYEVRGKLDQMEEYERRGHQIIESRGADKRKVLDAYLAGKQTAYDDAARKG